VRKKIKIMLLSIFALIIGIIIYTFLFGQLFPYSPIIIGFSRHELSNTVLYIQKGAEYNYFTETDTLPLSVENFHNLKFKRKPEIFIFKDSISYVHRSPSKARFCTFYNSRITVSPWALKDAQKGRISLEIYLKHELSHSILYQHADIIHAFKYPQWLLEGIAVYSSNQMGTSWYHSKEETYNYIRQGNFIPPRYFRTGKENKVKLDVKYRNAFMYSEFACIVGYMIRSYGKENFLRYMKLLLKENNHNNAFKKIFNANFEEFILDFKKTVMEQTYK